MVQGLIHTGSLFLEFVSRQHGTCNFSHFLDNGQNWTVNFENRELNIPIRLNEIYAI